MRAAALASLLLLAAAGCDDRADEAPRPPPPPTYFGLEAEAGGRAVVATVNGRSVYDDCVARQAAAHDLDRRAALDECIGFELLAAEAERRGYLDDGEVQEAGKREVVRALIDADFELDDPGDIPEDAVRQAWQRFEGTINRPELRTTYFCRAELESPTPDDSAEERAARERAEALHRRIGGRRLSLQEFRDACVEVVGDEEAAKRPGLQHSKVQLVRAIRDDGSPQRLERAGERVDPSFAAAAFAVEGDSRASSPIRLRWGWDVLYIQDVAPAVNLSYEEAEPQLREQLLSQEAFRRTLFMRWAARFGEGLHIEVHPELLEAEQGALSLAGEKPE